MFQSSAGVEPGFVGFARATLTNCAMQTLRESARARSQYSVHPFYNNFRFRIPIERSDPRWMGAWWLGFLGSSVSALIIAIPILAFARELPEAKRHRAKDINQVGSFLYFSTGNEWGFYFLNTSRSHVFAILIQKPNKLQLGSYREVE